MTRLRPLLAAALALPLAACLSFGAKPPPTLMTLTPAATVAAGPARSVTDAQAIVLLVPTVPASLTSVRVPVQASPTAIAYLKDAQWADVPARLFRNLLAETVTARTGRTVADLRQPILSPPLRVTGRLQSFGVDAASTAVIVVFDAALVREGTAGAQTRRFEARVPVAAVDAANVAPALNQAANQVAGEVAEWIGQAG